MKRTYFHVVLGFFLCTGPSATADSLGPAWPFTVYSADRSLRAKAIPQFENGATGKTKVYEVRRGFDKKLYTYDWFPGALMVERIPRGVVLVRFGHWPGGTIPSDETLCFAFYLNGNLTKSYSTLDIAGSPNNVAKTVSHHRILRRTYPIRINPASHKHEFAFETLDGRVLRFDVESGEQIGEAELYPDLRKSEWFRENLAWLAMTPTKTEQFGSGRPRIISYPIICFGLIAGGGSNETNFFGRLDDAVIVEPREHFDSLIMFRGLRGDSAKPQKGEVWAFSGTLEHPFGLRVRSGVCLEKAK